MFKYCPSCGAKNEYDINPPKSCKCGLDFTQAFKTKSVNSPVVVPVQTEKKLPVKIIEVDENGNEFEVVKVVRKKKISLGAEAKSTKELDAEDFDDSAFENTTKEDVKEIAKEIKGSLDVSDFITEFEDKQLNFKDIYAEKLRNEENK